ncbi:MAG: OsmC family protein [Acidobacteria bacterium]|nr:OsmC family protein [Acidobacteriota bacterium]
MANATVHFAGNGFFLGVSSSGHAVVLETDGQRNAGASPIELLLVAVGGCMGSDVVDILRKKREQVTQFRVEVQGSRREEAPRSYDTIRLHHVITGRNLSEAAVQQALELSNHKYCSVAATLRPTAEVSVSYEIVEEA